MAPLPEAPQHDAMDIGMRERGGHVVSNVVILQFAVVAVDRQFGGFDGKAQFGISVENLQHTGRIGQCAAEMRLDADAIDGSARVFEEFEVVVKIILMFDVDSASIDDAEI